MYLKIIRNVFNSNLFKFYLKKKKKTTKKKKKKKKKAQANFNVTKKFSLKDIKLF